MIGMEMASLKPEIDPLKLNKQFPQIDGPILTQSPKDQDLGWYF
jgi:hypothetical protein